MFITLVVRFVLVPSMVTVRKAFSGEALSAPLPPLSHRPQPQDDRHAPSTPSPLSSALWKVREARRKEARDQDKRVISLLREENRTLRDQVIALKVQMTLIAHPCEEPLRSRTPPRNGPRQVPSNSAASPMKASKRKRVRFVASESIFADTPGEPRGQDPPPELQVEAQMPDVPEVADRPEAPKAADRPTLAEADPPIVLETPPACMMQTLSEIDKFVESTSAGSAVFGDSEDSDCVQVAECRAAPQLPDDDPMEAAPPRADERTSSPQIDEVKVEQLVRNYTRQMRKMQSKKRRGFFHMLKRNSEQTDSTNEVWVATSAVIAERLQTWYMETVDVPSPRSSGSSFHLSDYE